MQRIFSTFPDGWPGFGLLLLRVAAAAPLLVAAAMLLADKVSVAVWMSAVSCLAGALLLAGLWTPVGAATQALMEAWLAMGSGTFDADHAIRALIGVSLMMLGPGSWSIDARLYGRKRIDLSQ